MKQKIRPQIINGISTSFDWITQGEIDNMIAANCIETISLAEAGRQFYEATIREDGTIDQNVLKLGIVAYTLSRGLKIEILSELELTES